MAKDSTFICRPVSMLLLALSWTTVTATGWLRYESVSCEGNKQLENYTNITLENCKSGCAANGFGHFANFNNKTGFCAHYLYCNNPVCHTELTTYRALRGDDPWTMGCASHGPTPAPPPPPPVPTPAPGLVVPCFDSSCRHWNDTDGNRIEAHAAGMLQAPNSRWYWYGESKKVPQLDQHGVNLYSAPDIAGPWAYEGCVLNQSTILVPGQSGPFIIERPKVLYNAKTSTYVMWFHLDTPDYKFAHVGVATASRPQGPFKFVNAFLPDGMKSLDMSLFRDPLDHQVGWAGGRKFFLLGWMGGR